MNIEEKCKFIDDLCNAVRDSIALQAATGRLPEEWDGIELRWLLAEKFAGEARGAFVRNTRGEPDKQRRFREYTNEVLVRNL